MATSGKTFGPVDGGDLRAKWCAGRGKSFAEYIKQWQVIGPFPAGGENRQGLDLPTPIEKEFIEQGSGGIKPLGVYHWHGKDLRWQRVSGNEQGFVDLGQAVGRVEWAVAYAYTEVYRLRAREVVLRCGSDDGIKLWVNGQLVHAHETGRGYRPDSDCAPANLKAGINRIFVKIDNYTGGWGFGVAVPAENS